MKLPITSKVLFGIVALSIGASASALAQSTPQNAQWNALFDRIIRLEQNVKNLGKIGRAHV